MITQLSSTQKAFGLFQSAGNILKERYNLRPGQKVLVIYDGPKATIGKSFAQAARWLGATVDVVRLGKNRFSGPAHQRLAQKIASHKYDLFVNALAALVEEVNDRGILMKTEMASGGNFAHCPGIEESMLMIEVDYQKMIATTRKLLEALKNAVSVEVRTALGTDIRLDIEGRKFEDDVIPKEKDWGNFPCGEAFCAPIEEGVNGVMIADGSVGGFGILPQPLRFEIKNGRIISMDWLHNPAADSTLLAKIKETLSQDEGAGIVGELGIGLAPYPICGILLQDEKVGGTIHIAFGRNDLFGGKNSSRSHVDFLIRSPELTVSYPGNTPPRIIMREGKLLI